MPRCKLLLDTNVVVDFLHHREPFYEKARLLMLAARVGEFSVWVSSSQFTDIVYILTDGGKPRKVPAVLERLRKLRSFVNVVSVGDREIDGMLATASADPEDALLATLAAQMRVDAVVTRDASFPDDGTLRVCDCDGLFDWLEAEHGISYAEIAL